MQQKLSSDALVQFWTGDLHLLQKAAESERMAMDKYREGRISIVEVINAQLYHQQAKVNYIQSKLNAQVARSSYHRVTCSFIL